MSDFPQDLVTITATYDEADAVDNIEVRINIAQVALADITALIETLYRQPTGKPDPGLAATRVLPAPTVNGSYPPKTDQQNNSRWF